MRDTGTILTAHWTEPFIGVPWLAGGRDPATGVDCWGLLVAAYRQAWGIEVQEYATKALIDEREHTQVYSDQFSSGLWTEVPECDTIDGDVVALGKGKTFHHVGMVVRSPGKINILHSHRTTSVIEPLSVMRSVGWNLSKFYRHADRCAHHKPV